MRTPIVVLAAVILLPSAARGQEAAAVDRLGWLQGCWEAATAQRTVEEFWMAPRGNSMVGMSRTVRDGRLRDHELLVLRERDGRLVLHAYPSDQPAAEFPVQTMSDSAVVFEDPAHDFPQRIGYQRLSADSATAWIGGTVNGQERRIDFRYRRVACPSD